jgi:hypothetical protein
VPFGQETAEEAGLEIAKLDVVTGGDEIVEVLGRKFDEGFGGVVLAIIEVEAGIIEDGGEDVDDNKEELEDVKEDE